MVGNGRKSVIDGNKLSDEQLGKLHRKFDEIVKRLNEQALDFEDTKTGLQDIIIEGKASLYLGVIKKTHEIKVVEHLIDCDAAPFIPPGLTVEEHKPGGLFKFDSAKISLFLSKKQKKGFITGNGVRKELAKMLTLNANVLDYLLAHPELIPEEWKGKAVFFWGTIYRDSNGYLFVRDLYWADNGWHWDYFWLGLDFDADYPAAFAS